MGQALATAYNPLIAVLIMLGAGMALALAAAWLQASSMSGYIGLFISHAKKIAQGEYNISLPFSRTAELTNLGQNLRFMAETINRREKELTASEMQLAITLDSIGDAVIATDYDLKKHYNFKSIEVVKAYEPGLPMVPCEGSKIQQVLLNILSNGAYAMFLNRSADAAPPKFILRLSFDAEPGVVRMEIETTAGGLNPRPKDPDRSAAAAAETAGGVFLTFYPDLDNVGGSAYPRVHGQGPHRAVVDAGAAFHTGVEIHNGRFFVFHFKHMLGADMGTQGAADAFFAIQLQGGNSLIMAEGFHKKFSLRLSKCRFSQPWQRPVRIRCISICPLRVPGRPAGWEYTVSSLFQPRRGR